MTGQAQHVDSTQAADPPLRPPHHKQRRPVAEQWQWQTLAACRGMDVNLFYHPPGESRQAKSNRINHAKAICQSCSVVAACAAWALTTAEPYGIWGGLSEEERATRLGVRNLRYPAPRPDDSATTPGTTRIAPARPAPPGLDKATPAPAGRRRRQPAR